MVGVLWSVLAVIATACLVVVTGSTAVIVYVLYRWYTVNPSPEVRRQRVRVYHDIATSAIELNREAVELEDEGMLQDAHERLVLNQESELATRLDTVTQAYHGGYYIISPAVRDAVGEYVDYVASYHERGLNLGKLLRLSGAIVQSMRTDLALEGIFPDDAADPETAREFDADRY